LSRPCLFFVLFFHLSPLLLYLLSFPTRRSSDLIFIRSNLQKSFFLENIFLQNVRYIAFVLKIVPTQVKIIFPNTPLLPISVTMRSEEHTSELQSRFDLVCRLLLEKKKTKHSDIL